MICRFGWPIGSKAWEDRKVGGAPKLPMASRRIAQRWRKVSAPLLVRLSNYRPLLEEFLKLYHALRAMDDAGLMPGITSAFRDDYRQSIASGNKAASDSSYHGGSRRGGYGHGLAADIVSVNGENRLQRSASSQELWKWIDAHEKELGIGRPYLDRDPPHVGPIDGKEYVAKRRRTNAQKAGLQTNNVQEAGLETKNRRLGMRNNPGATTRVKPAKSSNVSSLQEPDKRKT